MSASHGSAGSSGPDRRAPDAVERLYVYWLVSTVLLALVAIVAVLFTRGALRQQAREVADLEQRLAALEAAPSPAERTAPPPPLVQPAPATAPAPADVRTPGAPTPPPTPATKATAVPPVTTAPAIPVPPEAEIAANLNRVLNSTEEPPQVTDPAAAGRLVAEALNQIGRAQWSGATWARLAVVARLIGHNSAAEAFAKRAAEAGDPLVAYTEVSLRVALAQAAPQQAFPLAERFLQLTRGAPLSRVLLAAAMLASDEPANADEVLETVSDASALSPPDRLLLARLLMALEHWDRMAAVLAEAGRVPPELTAEHNFLQAVSLAQAGRTVEALAIFEYLAGHLPPEETGDRAATRPAGGEPRIRLTAAAPDRYEIEVWRGVTLGLAKQTEAARQVLEAAAQLDSVRPDASYYLGILEAQAGRPSVATSYLLNALASAARMAPAWEALAALELNAGHVEKSLEYVNKALEINERRASANFLAAIAYAKLGEREPAATALRAAVRLEPRLLEEAKQTEVLLRLFDPAEIESLAGEPTDTEAASQPNTAPEGP